MKILGIDPGTARIGWSILSTHPTHPFLNAYGLITTDANLSQEARLSTLYDDLSAVLTKFQPDCASVEDLYFANNAKTALAVGQARGIILLACFQHHVPIFSYSPLTIKRTITSDGTADKRQILMMIMKLLHLTTAPKPDDIADAIAIALTHAYTYKWKEAVV